jgi:rhodanese-related sulfurtransferase
LQNLATVDLHRYESTWELEPANVLAQFTDAIVGTVMLDLRQPEDFHTSHIPGSHNLPLQNCNALTPSPFFDTAVLEEQWKELEATFTSDRINALNLPGMNVYIVCYTGDTARVATSVLRARGVAACSVEGGITALRKELPLVERGRSLLQQDWAKMPVAATKEVRADSLSPPLTAQDSVAT